jgi:hypothetical protein
MTGIIEARVRDAYDAYLSGFQTTLVSEVISYFSVPVTVVAHGEANVLSDQEELEAMFAAAFESLRKVDYSHTIMTSQEVTVLDDSMALMQVAGTRYAHSGELLERVAAAYTYVRHGDTWKIVVMMPFGPME